MKITLTYKTETHGDKHFKECVNKTLQYYNSLLKYLIPIIQENHEKLNKLSAHEQILYTETLTHATKTHPIPKYDFDQRFPRCPSYLRRGAIQDAIGIVGSWKTKHDEWEANGAKSEEPQLSYNHHKSPSFYNTNMFKENTKGNLATARLKLFIGEVV